MAEQQKKVQEDVNQLRKVRREGEELIRAVESVTADQVTKAARGLKLDTVYRLTGKEG